MMRIERWVYTQIWLLTERSGIPLRRFAPFVFGRMIGNVGRKVSDD